MDRSHNPSDVICKLCEEEFILSENDDVDSNLPRVLLCGHIYCTSCLLSLVFDGAIKCPQCEVETTVSEGGVYGLQEDSRIIGLIYTSKMNKTKRSKIHRRSKLPSFSDVDSKTEEMEQPADITKIENMVDEALARGAENLAQLEHIHETLTNGLTEQVFRERARLKMEIIQATDKASCAVQKWKDVQLRQLMHLEEQFPATHMQVCDVKEKIKALEIAMQMAREVRRVPFLEQYCSIDKLLEKLQVPVDSQTFDMNCITVGTGMSFVFQLECLNHSMSLSLKMEGGTPKCFSTSPPKGRQQSNSTRKSPWQHAEATNGSCTPPSRNELPSPQNEDQAIPGADMVSPEGSNQSPRPHGNLSLSRHSSASNVETPDIIIEELLDEKQEPVSPPTGPELANDKQRIHRRKKHHFEKRRNVSQWVVLTHVENPSHFYVQYVAEKRESEALSKMINHFCSRDTSHFTPSDTVEIGSLVFVKGKEGLWCRATVAEVSQYGCDEAVKACPVNQLASIRVFLLDYGCTKSIIIHSEAEVAELSLKAVNNHLRKVGETMNLKLRQFAPQAVRCSLKDLVPYELTKGWSKEAQVEFLNVVGSAAVEMRPLGQDRGSLLVDLRKVPMDQSSDVPISVRVYLVFVEVARFYCPVILNGKPLQYYPSVCPKLNTELNAVVSHINNPADFYIQLVDNMESLLLSAKLQECYNETVARQDDLSVYCPVIGQAYVARYDDKSWYRARVIGLTGDRKVKVCYVDFGNESIVSVSDLRKIKDEFFALPCMAIHCRLYNLSPLDGETWSDACTDRFISFTLDKLVTVVVTGTVSKTELLVKLFESDLNGPKANIAALLVEEDLARFKELKSEDDTSDVRDDDSAIWDPPLAPGSDPEGVCAVNGEQKEEPPEFQPLLKLPAQVKDLQVKVSHVNSPSSIYVLLTQYDRHLKRLCELVKQECALKEPQDEVWKADMYCAAHINGVWERGQICSDVTSSNIVEVMRCDHGNKVKLHVSSLLPLPSSLMGSFALECTLTDIRPAGGQSSWTATACDLISCYLTGASAVITIKEVTDERPVPVDLFCSNKMGQFVSIADFLVSEGLALRERRPRDADVQTPPKTDAQSPVRETQTDGAKKPPPKPATRTIISAEKVKTQLYQSPELPRLGHALMKVTAIGEDGIIYVRAQNAECQLVQLRERIQQCMKTLPRQKPYTWKTVLGCAVIGPDMLWYRGQVLEVLGGQVKVQYVDYGLVETIPVVHVYPTLLCEDVPQLCMPCQLHNINPVGDRWHWDALALMKELLLNRTVDTQVMELPTDPRGTLTVEIFLDGLSLSRILCHHEHGSMDGTVSAQMGHSVTTPAFLDDWDIDTEGLTSPEEPVLGPFIDPILPQKGEKFPVRVKHLLTPNQLFLWCLDGTTDLEVDGETLSEALARINSNNSLSQLTNFPQGGPCLAEYIDGKYYRAKLLKFTSIEPVMIMVQHIDFGSDDILPTSQIRQMPAKLLAYPTQAIRVKLGGFKPPSVTGQEDILPYSPEWSVKSVMYMMKLLHDDITACVVSREPELRVLLYNQDGELIHLSLVKSGLAELE